MSTTGGDDIEILRIETLSAEHYPLRRYRFAQRRRDGSRSTVERQVYELGPSVAVLPIDRSRGTVLLVRQLRLPAFLNGDAPSLVEVCAGHVEPGDDAAMTARREAEEELGYRLEALVPVFVLYMSPGLITEKIHFFVAEYDPAQRCGRGGGLAAEGEDIEVLEVTLEEAWRMVQAGAIADAKTALLLQHAMLSLQGASARLKA
jgi:GDP-mannose pyrophosphatase NudK